MPRKHSRDEVLGTLSRTSQFLRPYKAQVVGIFFLILLVSLFSLVFPALLGWIINLLNHKHPTKLVWLANLIIPQGATGWDAILPVLIFNAVLLILRAATLLARNQIMQFVGMRVTCDLRVTIFAHLQKLSLKFYEERQTGRIAARITQDADALHQMITGASVSLIGELAMALGVFVLLFYYNWKLALTAAVFVPLFLGNYLWHRRRMRLESRRHRRHWTRVVGFLHERIANNRVVRAFATEDEEHAAFRDRIQNDFKNFRRVQIRNTMMGASAELLSGLGALTATGLGSWLVIHGSMDPGDIVAFLGYLGMLYGPIVRVFDANMVLQSGVTAMEKIFAILDTKPHIPDNDALPEFPRMRGKVEFHDVSFAYRIGQVTLENVDFTVQPGEMVALVGASGAGKSTVITLLSRFYDPTSGEVRIDDKAITGYNVQSVRRQIGIVMQDSILFSGSLGENIRYGKPDATWEEVVAAARAANAHEFISELPNGYDSRVGERGVSLSGGQRQRVAIARVLLKDPRILILDEATSALDSQSERLIQDAMDKLMQNRTAIVIAHRLSTVVNANRILVMDKGRVVDSGTHAELLAKPGIYRNLHQLQFSDRAAA